MPPFPSLTAQSPVVESSFPRVPALFVFGDSSVDCGTNNFLGTLARADRLPYGRDFDTHQPTGRFSNGRIPVDFLGLKFLPSTLISLSLFLASRIVCSLVDSLDWISFVRTANRLGLPFVPSYLGQSGAVKDMFRGVNYASAGAGIILSSGSELVITQKFLKFQVFFRVHLRESLWELFVAGPAGFICNAGWAVCGYLSADDTEHWGGSFRSSGLQLGFLHINWSEWLHTFLHQKHLQCSESLFSMAF